MRIHEMTEKECVRKSVVKGTSWGPEPLQNNMKVSYHKLIKIVLCWPEPTMYH